MQLLCRDKIAGRPTTDECAAIKHGSGKTASGFHDITPCRCRGVLQRYKYDIFAIFISKPERQK